MRLVLAAALALTACRAPNEERGRGTCVHPPSGTSDGLCIVNGLGDHCSTRGSDVRQFFAGEESKAGVKRCAASGFTRPSDAATSVDGDLGTPAGKNYRTSDAAEVERALERGDEVVFFRP